MQPRVNRHGMVGPYGARYSWVYWAVIAAAFALLVVDIFDDSAVWNIAVVVLLIIAIAVRPGGIRGPRAAAAKDASEGSDRPSRPATPRAGTP